MRLVLCLAALAIVSMPALAAQPSDSGSDSSSGNSSSSNSSVSMDLDVVAKQLDIARQQIQPSLGATTYNFSPQSLQDIPQGDNAPLNQVLLQAPGVAQDSFGQIHLRGEHANVQYRINGVELPEGLSVFGQALESRFANSISLITGALPAQYGFQTAGIVDIQTKTGTTNPGLAISMYGGSWAGCSRASRKAAAAARWTGMSRRIPAQRSRNRKSDLELQRDPRHHQPVPWPGVRVGIIDPDTRISMILGGFEGHSRSPTTPVSRPWALRQRHQRLQQREPEREPARTHRFRDHFPAKARPDIDAQISAYARYSSLSFSPDWLGDLLFNGIAQQATRTNAAYGVQADGSWRINDQHTLRSGFLVQQEIANGKTFSQVLPVDSTGTPTTDCRRASATASTRPVGCRASMCRTNGASCRQ